MSKEVTPIRFVAVVVAFVLMSFPCFGQGGDWHELSLDVCVKSSFAHGYMHGYEEGFHVGDLDIQMGRSFRNIQKQEQFKRKSGYRTSFGDKSSYEGGYREGYLVGYTDSYAGRNFRAVMLVRETARPVADQKLQSDYRFDSAFKEGYLSGRTKGLQDGRSSASESAAVQCNEKEKMGKGGAGSPDSGYCDAFSRGYKLGYSDGYANQKQFAPVIARK